MKRTMNNNIAMNTGLTVFIIIGIVSMFIVMIYSTMDICDTMLTIAGLFALVIGFIVMKINVKEDINNMLEEMEETAKES